MSTQSPAIAVADTFQENLPKPKRQGGTWTWLIFFTFVWFCFVKAVSLPQNPAAIVQTPVAPVAETPVIAETPAPAEITATVETPASLAVSISGSLFDKAQELFAAQQFSDALAVYELYLKQTSPSYENISLRMEAVWKSAVACEKTNNIAAAKLKYEQLIAEYAQEKGWMIRSARKSLERLAAGTAQ